MRTPRTLRYLTEGDIRACLPSIEDQLELASEALTALSAGAAEMPLKIGVHPRNGAVVHAMPAWHRKRDIVGLKWVGTYPRNATRGLPAIDALIILNDPETGIPTHIMDGALITALRTAAVSGVAIRLYAPVGVRRVAILGAGVQGSSHANVLVAILPGVDFQVFDRHPERAGALADKIRATQQAQARAENSARDAVTDADVVVTAGALGSASQALSVEWLQPNSLIVAIDADTYAPAELARTATAFVVDDRERFLAYLREGLFAGYPEPTLSLGEALHRVGLERRDSGRVLVSTLGTGVADILLAHAICRVADEQGIGLTIPR